MRYNIEQSGLIRGGTVDVTLNDMGDVYDCQWSAEIKLGKKIFGKWIPLPGFSKSGSERISKDVLSEAYIRENDAFKYGSFAFYKQADDHLTTGQNNDVNIDLYLRFDGMDPVEINMIYVEWNGYKVTANLE